MAKLKKAYTIIDRILKQSSKVLEELRKQDPQKAKQIEKEIVELKAFKGVAQAAELEGCTNPSLLYDALAINLNGLTINTDFETIGKEAVKRSKSDSLTAILFNKEIKGTESNSKYSIIEKPMKVKNPWSKEHWNLTQQAIITREQPELASLLKIQAEEGGTWTELSIKTK